jgi:putative nucleotidyltransferase with HDIG domain
VGAGIGDPGTLAGIAASTVRPDGVDIRPFPARNTGFAGISMLRMQGGLSSLAGPETTSGYAAIVLDGFPAFDFESVAGRRFDDGHSREVAAWAWAVGERLRLGRPDLLELELGALLHDLGKVRVPDHVLSKPGPLDLAELELVHHHPVWGAELLEEVPGLARVATIVRFHHERWDGSGYPDGLRRDRIPLGSRIVAVCDAYQAMTSARPYRAASPPAAAAHELRAGAGTQFDPALVDCFVEVLQERGWPLSPPAERDLVDVEGVS